MLPWISSARYLVRYTHYRQSGVISQRWHVGAARPRNFCRTGIHHARTDQDDEKVSADVDALGMRTETSYPFANTVRTAKPDSDTVAREALLDDRATGFHDAGATEDGTLSFVHSSRRTPNPNPDELPTPLSRPMTNLTARLAHGLRTSEGDRMFGDNPPSVGGRQLKDNRPFESRSSEAFWNRGIRVARARVTNEDLLPTLHPQAFEWAEMVLKELDSTGGSIDIEALATRCGEESWSFWVHTTLWLMAYMPAETIRFLLATCASNFPLPANYLMNALLVVTLYDMYSRIGRTFSSSRQLADAFIAILERETELNLTRSAPIIWLLIQEASHHDVLRVYHTLRKQEAQYPGWTRLQFTTYFARQGAFDLVNEALWEAVKEPFEGLYSHRFLQNCSLLLRLSMKQPDGLRVGLRFLEKLTDKGVEVDDDIINIVMLNATEAGDVATANAIYESLESQGQGRKPTPSTFHILLRACQLYPDDIGPISATIRSAVEAQCVRGHPVVADLILRTLHQHHARNHPKTTYRTLAEAFSELYDTVPIRKLGLPWPVPQRKDPVQTLMPPSRDALEVIFRAYVVDLILHASDRRQLSPIYLRWREMIAAGDPIFVALLEHDTFANLFIMGFASHPNTLALAARVVRNMQQPLPAAAKELDVQPAPPSTRSWNRLLYGYVRNGDLEKCEQIITQMTAADTLPNADTWNHLLSAYIRKQDEAGVSKVLTRRKRAGIPWDEPTIKILSGLRDVDALQRIVEGVDIAALDIDERVTSILLRRMSQNQASENLNDADDAWQFADDLEDTKNTTPEVPLPEALRSVSDDVVVAQTNPGSDSAADQGSSGGSTV